MKRTLLISFLAVLLAVLGIYILWFLQDDEGKPNPVEHFAVYPKIDYTKVKDPDLVKKGEYLTKLGDCIACHTELNGQPFAGGRAMDTPFGVFYSPNITPSKAHGLGNWSYDDFANALRHGVRPDGANYFPVFPYLYYTKITDEDMKALKAYFDAIPVVEKPSKEHDVSFPFNIRFFQYFWKMLFFYPYDGIFQDDPNATAQINRGEYLVEGLAHCGMCHTPINFLGGPKRWLAYTGNTVDGWYAPNITGSNLKSVTEDQLVRVFVHGEKPGGGMVQGPMKEVNHDSLAYIPNEDLYAMAAYIKSTTDPLPPEKIDTTELGKSVYDKRCSACHNMGAGGAPKITDKKEWLARLEKKGIETLYNNVINGYKGMPARGLCTSAEDEGCDDDAMKAAVDYIYSLQEEGVTDAAPAKGEAPKPITKAKVKAIFNETCATCHTTGALGAPVVGDKAQWSQRVQKGVDILIHNTIHGFSGTNNEGACIVKRGGCHDCTDAEIIAVIKYMLDESISGKDFKLW